LSAALAGNGCGCFVPDLTRLTMPQCAGARRHELYLICAIGASAVLCDRINYCNCKDRRWLLRSGNLHAACETSQAALLTTSLAIYIPSSSQILSTRFLTASVMVMTVPHSRLVSPGHLLVASIPILLPRPLMGEAKSR